MPEQATRPTPPGPSGLERVTLVGRYATEDPVEVLARLRDRHGPTVSLDRPGRDGQSILVTDPDHVERVLETNRTNYRKADVYREELSEAFGEGLLTSEGDQWASQNRTIAPLFQPNKIHRFADLILTETDAMVDGWLDSDTTVDLLSATQRVTLIIIGKAIFSEDLEDRADDIGEALAALRAGFRQQTGGAISPPDWLPTRTRRRANRALEFLDETVYDIIEDRRGAPADHDDLLSRLLAATDEETGERLDDEQVRDQVLTFLLAGHETTATALGWTWLLLSSHPEIHRRLAEEVGTSPLGEPGVGFEPALLEPLETLERVVKESMRLYPPVPVFARQARESDVLGDYRVPAGTEVLLSQYLTHRDPRHWAEPERFHPDRWREEDRHRYAFYPFGGGPRTCTGMSFAMLEAQLVLGRAVARCRVDLADPSFDQIGVNSAVTMTPEPQPQVTVNPWP